VRLRRARADSESHGSHGGHSRHVGHGGVGSGSEAPARSPKGVKISAPLGSNRSLPITISHFNQSRSPRLGILLCRQPTPRLSYRPRAALHESRSVSTPGSSPSPLHSIPNRLFHCSCQGRTSLSQNKQLESNDDLATDTPVRALLSPYSDIHPDPVPSRQTVS
jgi:hypothetical protein